MSDGMVAQAVLRCIYSKVFASPGEVLLDGTPAAMDRRRQLCELLGPYNALPVSVEVYRGVNRLLSKYAGTECSLHHDDQFVPFRKAFSAPAYAALRDVQGNRPNEPEAVDGKCYLVVGPYELQVLYSGLFNVKEGLETETHRRFEHLKGAALANSVKEVCDVFQEIYDSNVFIDEGDRRYSGVRLVVSDEYVLQLRDFFRNASAGGLEPYGDGTWAPCLRVGGQLGYECY